MLSRFTARTCAGALALGLLVFSAGCGGIDYRSRGSVKGLVTIGTKNLTAGTVTFTSAIDPAYTASAKIDKTGNYHMPDAPLGDVKVTVFVPALPMGGLARMKGGPPPTKEAKDKDKASVSPEDPSKRISIMGDMPDYVVPIPDRYGNIETSGLTYKVQRGEQTHNIPLTP